MKIMGTGQCIPFPAVVPAHGPAEALRAHSTHPSPAGENQGSFPTWTQLEVLLSPPLTSHASRFIPRDFLQYLCDFLWPLGVHSQGLKNTLIAGIFPEVQVPLIPHHIPAIPRKLNPAEPMEAPVWQPRMTGTKFSSYAPTPNFLGVKANRSLHTDIPQDAIQHLLVSSNIPHVQLCWEAEWTWLVL